MSLSPIQEKIVNYHGGNMLVSAAAGSGKTTVMTQRILRMLCDESNPLSVDRLLVVTFTNAAAAHMKDVIYEGLTKAVAENPKSVWLNKQLLALPNARIMTIDAFCLRVIRDNINLIPALDPGFRVGGNTETELLLKDSLSSVLEDLYAEAEKKPENYQDFKLCVKLLCGKKNDTKLANLVLNLYRFIRSLPNPLVWMEEKTWQYQSGDLSPKVNAKLREFLLQNAKIARRRFEDLQKIAYLEEVFFGKYLEFLDSFIEEFDNKTLFEVIDGMALPRFVRKKNVGLEYGNEELAQFISISFDSIKGDYRKLVSAVAKSAGLINGSDASLSEKKEEVYHFLLGLKQVVTRLDEKYAEVKGERSVVDFSDFSHFALDILCQKDESGVFLEPSVPTEAAKLIGNGLDYIFIDEYQDSNLIQELILTSIAKRGDGGKVLNVFMVGDVKQSIYRFRHADPYLFMDKRDTYFNLTESSNPEKDLSSQGDPALFLLSTNYRSVPLILKSVNYLFKGLMNGSAGEIRYTKDEQLIAPPVKPEDLSAKVVLTVIEENNSEVINDKPAEAEESVDADDSEVTSEADSFIEENVSVSDLKKFHKEAYLISEQIKKLLSNNEQIGYSVKETDEKTGENVYVTRYRNIEKKDIVVLLPVVANAGKIMKDMLESQGIPAISSDAKSYFQSPEIILLCQILSIIDNPRQDIALAAVLHSPCFGFTPDDLAQIRLTEKDCAFYDALLGCMKKSKEMKKKISPFVMQLNAWREASEHESVHDLLWRIYRDTGLYFYVSSLPAPLNNTRKANLDKMLDLSISFEDSAYSGLYQFLRYLDMIQKYEGAEAEAQVNGENDDCVRIMSIHKSKGLEFPVVFLGMMGKSILYKNNDFSFVFDRELGIGAPLYKCKIKDTLQKVVLAEEKKHKEMAEKIRLLYVGMTRAVNRLYISGMGTLPASSPAFNPDVDINQSDYFFEDDEILYAKTYLDWIYLAISKASANGIDCPFEIQSVQVIALENKSLQNNTEAFYGNTNTPVEESNCVETQKSYYEHLFDWVYPHQKDVDMKARYSVSEIKKNAWIEDVEEEEDQTSHLVSWGGGGARIGTVMHAFLANAQWNLVSNTQDLENEIERLKALDLLNEDDAELLNRKALLAFSQSDLCRRMLCAEKVWKEQPFILSLTVDEIKEMTDTWPDSFGDNDSSFMVQGIIDLFFVEDGEIVLIDYKTDHSLDEKALSMYSLQLKIYEKALKGILKLPVKERLLYSTSMNKVIAV